MDTLKNKTVTTVTVTNGHLKMKYDISKATRPLCRTSVKAQNVSKSCSHRPQKTCTNPSFRCCSLSLAHTSARRNFNILTTVGRS